MFRLMHDFPDFDMKELFFPLLYQARFFALVCHLCILSLAPGRKATTVKAKQNEKQNLQFQNNYVKITVFIQKKVSQEGASQTRPCSQA